MCFFFYPRSDRGGMRNRFRRMQVAQVTQPCRKPNPMTLWQRFLCCLAPPLPATPPPRDDSRHTVESRILRDELVCIECVDVIDTLYDVSLHTLHVDDHVHSREIRSNLQAIQQNERITSEEKMRTLVRMLLKRIHQLDQVQSCAVCMSKPRCAVMMPCAHLVTCDECACEICPICARRVETTLYVFPS